jgi:RNA polymerase sigma-70 factor (ECF subfamily)
MKEKELLNKFNQRNDEILHYIYTNHYKHMYNYALRFLSNEMEAEDCVQDVIINIWFSSVIIKSKKSLIDYFFTSIRNKSYNINRGIKVKNEYTEMIKYINDDYQNSVEENLIDREQKEIIESALIRITKKNRIVIEENMYENKSLVELSTELNVPYETLKSRKRQGIKELKRIIQINLN